jgi:DeoR/GlpR family transcriptional regulator of sugar metabolism
LAPEKAPEEEAVPKETLAAAPRASLSEIAEEVESSKQTVANDLARLKLDETGPELDGAKPSTRALLSQSDQNDWRTPRKYLEVCQNARKHLTANRGVAAIEAAKTLFFAE